MRSSRRRIFFIIVMLYGCIKLFGSPHFHLFHFPDLAHVAIAWPPQTVASAQPAPILPDDIAGDAVPSPLAPYLTGRRVWGNGTEIDLGDRRTRLPFSLLSRFFPAPMILASCLTEAPPAPAASSNALPVRDDWPGFYGAPWTARANGNLFVLLDVYAPRKTAAPVPAPQFQIYPNYTGQPDPAFSTRAPAAFTRGSKAVLYRVFLNGPAGGSPVRCLDLVVQNGENNGIGHLYYEKYHHYYESTASFVIQQ